MILSSSGRGLANVDGTGSFGFVILSSGLYGTTAVPGSLLQAGSDSFATGGVDLSVPAADFGAPDDDDDEPGAIVFGTSEDEDAGPGAVIDGGGSLATGAGASPCSAFCFGAYRH